VSRSEESANPIESDYKDRVLSVETLDDIVDIVKA